ncbi:glycosyltransferase family A protein [Arthrobacter flavus]|uniref:Glycosyltransferase family A protein n=1 Tax=Arthrobacter flavus TaxID=95172 RepID=A0ABW4Q8R2_9MICC
MHSIASSANSAVDVIIATRDRHELLLQTIDSILGQDYPGMVRITVVYDRSTERADLARTSTSRPIRVMSNRRTPGLPGSRNTGLLAATAPLVAFCDDDDLWRGDKLQRQISALRDQDATGCVSGIDVHYGERCSTRIPAVVSVTEDGLSGSRLTGAHPSTFLFQREHLLANVGLVDEELPYGYGEDYDLLLRAAQQGRIAVLPEVTVDVLWHPKGSYFSQQWQAMSDGVGYLMNKHPSIRANRRGAAWMEGQRAFALAALGNQRAAARRMAATSLSHSVLEPRAYLALAMTLNLVKPETILRTLNARGRGI